MVSVMSNKLGLREVTIIGSVVASAFFIISSFSVNIDMMLVTYGIMGGSLLFYRPLYWPGRVVGPVSVCLGNNGVTRVFCGRSNKVLLLPSKVVKWV